VVVVVDVDRVVVEFDDGEQFLEAFADQRLVPGEEVGDVSPGREERPGDN